MLKGCSLPRTPEARGSMVPASPWHYISNLIVMSIRPTPRPCARAPAGWTPSGDPAAPTAIFGDWRRCGDGGGGCSTRRAPLHGVPHHHGRDARRPSRSRPARSRGWIRTRAGARLVQGFPEAGAIGWGSAPDGRRARSAGAGVRRPRAAGGRRLPEVTVTLESLSDTGADARRSPLVNVAASGAGWPRSSTSRPCTSWPRRSAATARSSEYGGLRDAELHDAPNEEHAALAPVRIGAGFRFTFAYTVDDSARGRSGAEL